MIARYGGEEFVAILPGLTGPPAGEIAEKIRLAVESMKLPNSGNSQAQVVAISIGVASCVPDQDEQP